MTLPTCKTFGKAYSFLLDEGTCGFAVECSVKTVLTSLQRESSSFGVELLSCPEPSIGSREYSREQRKRIVRIGILNACVFLYSMQKVFLDFLDATEGDVILEINIKHKNTATCNTRNQQSTVSSSAWFLLSESTVRKSSWARNIFGMVLTLDPQKN